MRSGVNKPFHISLDNVRNGKLITVKGRYVKVVDASSASAIVQIAIAGNFEERYEALKKGGYIYDGEGFENLYIKNTAQSGEWVRVIVSDGPEDYNVENPSQSVIDEIATPVVVRGGDTRTHFNETVSTSAEVLLAANTDRTGWFVFNNGDYPIYIGNSSGVTTVTGTPVPPQTGIGGDDQDAVYAISANAGQDVRGWGVD